MCHYVTLDSEKATAESSRDGPKPSINGKAKPKTADKATRLPDDWRLPDEWRDWAVTVYHLEPQRAVRLSLAFRDYWIAKPGKDAVKRDWLATWRNWIRREMGDA